MRSLAISTAVLATVAMPVVAAGGGLDLDLIGSRSVGRAGAMVVSEDGGVALLLNPAGLARRADLRIQVGAAIVDDDTHYRSPDADATGAPTITSRAAATAAPFVAVQAPLGELVLGVTYAQTGDLSRALPSAEFNQPLDEIALLFPHRYGGTALEYHRHTLAAGGAWRATSWLGVGLALTCSWVELSERRRIWPGFASRDGPVGNPLRDLDLELGGRDRVVPGLDLGVLVAPPHAPLEIAASVSYRADAHLAGVGALRATRATDYPHPLVDHPTDAATLVAPLVVRTGLRYLGDRLFVEAAGEIYWFATSGAPTWQLSGIAVRDDTGRVADLTRVPSLIDQRDHAAARVAADYEVVRGFLWLSLGYARRTAASHREAVSPIHGDLGGTTIGLGAEGQWSSMTMTIGYARTLIETVAVDPSTVFVVNPFDAGTATVGGGRYQRAQDTFGAALEIAWD